VPELAFYDLAEIDGSVQEVTVKRHLAGTLGWRLGIFAYFDT
jgi:hypothetical protein